ncbi:Iron-binding zinc finger CDGSH type [Leishmania donovani]|uniref:Iron-binding zinc finger CDGSH type family protein n=1 Tax=Leishmania donovani TaxID=5661 RepID=A0A504XJX4_LEIDO|nr:Iron-binding zinc finger CDGSH type family protein [Leishmania donovani]CAJ1992946.1 Iron-binding zinc finger CDGSH type [Leishmania donovani]VDZ48776.1 Iron-binding_zinc_finger_CDGSH_type_putative/Pfam:PF09360 [Leishmania donovani]
MQRCRLLAASWKTKVDPTNPRRIVHLPNRTPCMVTLEAGAKYYWCSCGLSKTQPFCDGAHRAYNEEHKTDLKPKEFTVDTSKKYLLCRCKHTDNSPFCDLSHVGVLFRTMVGIEKIPGGK